MNIINISGTIFVITLITIIFLLKIEKQKIKEEWYDYVIKKDYNLKEIDLIFEIQKKYISLTRNKRKKIIKEEKEFQKFYKMSDETKFFQKKEIKEIIEIFQEINSMQLKHTIIQYSISIAITIAFIENIILKVIVLTAILSIAIITEIIPYIYITHQNEKPD